MSAKKPDRAEIERFVRKNKVALAIGALILFLMFATDEEQGYAGGGGQPVIGSDMPAGDGTVDMDEWRRRSAAEDREQRDRVDSIREVERCYDPETGETREVSIHSGC